MAGLRTWFRCGRERFFDSGQLRLVFLHLILEKPSYGYEIIKAIEERVSGGYAPRPGARRSWDGWDTQAGFFGRGRSPQIKRAIVNLRYALKMRVERGDLNAEQVSKIAEAIDNAARAIDEA